jgi:hypothetical protein
MANYIGQQLDIAKWIERGPTYHQVTIPQLVMMRGTQICAPILLTMTLDGRVKTVKTKEYTSVPVLMPSMVKPRSAGKPSEIAFAKRSKSWINIYEPYFLVYVVYVGQTYKY